ncbi:hypothetical protein [Rhizobium sp. BK418]|uniref:hypothetical protein n=1 Tax=Rhizobium sp. BK418 TaxID=2512120 RepID=UPI0010433284|nr:hypothetical protein [Rhizobium sp. BK418]TCR95964.1 hypothetical protein EV281_11212 [Rhizobium sp. BK418]
MKDVPSNEPPTGSIADSDAVVPGLTREQSAEKAEKVLKEWVIALAKRCAQEDHMDSNRDQIPH